MLILSDLVCCPRAALCQPNIVVLQGKFISYTEATQDALRDDVLRKRAITIKGKQESL